jgi:hypothetical protein
VERLRADAIGRDADDARAALDAHERPEHVAHVRLVVALGRLHHDVPRARLRRRRGEPPRERRARRLVEEAGHVRLRPALLRRWELARRRRVVRERDCSDERRRAAARSGRDVQGVGARGRWRSGGAVGRV